MKIKFLSAVLVLTLVCLFSTTGYSQEPTRIGTTAASFLEYGYGAAGSALGDAYVSVTRDLSSVFWNPAGITSVENTQVMFLYQPWLADINTSFWAVGHTLPGIGTIAMNIISVDYGKMPVTTLDYQEGTGEMFSANDMAVSFSFARDLTTWFAFGASAKYITSKIWHTNASAVATDLGVIIKTNFFSPTGNRNHGMNIGMSINNYGTRMQYDGLDLIVPIDIEPDEAGNFRDVAGQFRLSQWELPLAFRIGVSMKPIVSDNYQLLLSMDALHPNNNSESVNLGAEYSWTAPGLLKMSLRTGYKALFMTDSIYGLTFGLGLQTFLIHNTSVWVDYAYQNIDVLGGVNSFNVGFWF